jgi:hypothetical protein
MSAAVLQGALMLYVRSRSSQTTAAIPLPQVSTWARALTPVQVGQPMLHPCENQKFSYRRTHLRSYPWEQPWEYKTGACVRPLETRPPINTCENQKQVWPISQGELPFTHWQPQLAPYAHLPSPLLRGEHLG